MTGCFERPQFLTCVFVVLVLLAGFGSDSTPATVAVFVIVPAAVGLMTIVTIAVALRLRPPRLQMILPVISEQVP
jgi:hypothetical protein